MPSHMVAQRRSSSYSSASVRKIQRERDVDGSKNLAITAKKPSPIKKPSAPAPPLSRSPRRERARIPASEKITAGTTISVRTRVGKLRGGRQLVLWLSAVVVSAPEEGYLTVVYKGNFPPEDPFKTVRVSREETKKMDITAATSSVPAAATIATSAAARPSSNNAAAPRPTTAGKSVAVLKKFYPEAF